MSRRPRQARLALSGFASRPAAGRSRRAVPGCRCRRAPRSPARSGKAAGRLASAASTSAMRPASSAGFTCVGLGEHDLMADRRLAERVEHRVVGVLEAVAGVDQHIDAGEVGAAAQVGVDQRGPGRDLGFGGGGIAVARHVDQHRASPPPVKKISSWVRPGVREVRASALRPVSALIRLDLPTLERPAKAISTPRIGGSEATELAAATKCQSPANSRRPALDLVAGEVGIGHGCPSVMPGPKAVHAPRRGRVSTFCPCSSRHASASSGCVALPASARLPRSLDPPRQFVAERVHVLRHVVVSQACRGAHCAGPTARSARARFASARRARGRPVPSRADDGVPPPVARWSPRWRAARARPRFAGAARSRRRFTLAGSRRRRRLTPRKRARGVNRRGFESIFLFIHLGGGRRGRRHPSPRSGGEGRFGLRQQGEAGGGEARRRIVAPHPGRPPRESRRQGRPRRRGQSRGVIGTGGGPSRGIGGRRRVQRQRRTRSRSVPDEMPCSAQMSSTGRSVCS